MLVTGLEVLVEKKEGKLIGHKDVDLVDLPNCLSAFLHILSRRLLQEIT